MFSNLEISKSVGRLFSLALTLGLLVFLGVKLSQIGWRDVIDSRPREALFYLLVFLNWLSIPIAEVILYSKLLERNLWPQFLIFVRKRVLNFGVVSYSGEAYFTHWLQKQSAMEWKKAIALVRDINLVSASVSGFLLVVLLLLFLSYGQVNFLNEILKVNPLIIFFALAGLSLLFPVLRWLARLQDGLSKNQIFTSSGIFVVRLLITFGLMVAQWAVVLPEVSLSFWFSLLVLWQIATRIPFMPSHDFLLAGLASLIAKASGASEAEFVSLFVTAAACNQVFNFGGFLTASVLKKTKSS